jgi:hypothetical protein
MHAQRPGPTHVRILNDLPVDCTSVSLTASFCVAQQKQAQDFSQNDETACLGQIGCLTVSVSTTVVRGTNHVTLPRNADLDYASSNHTTQQFSSSRCGRVELCPAESQSLLAASLVSQRYKNPLQGFG